MNLGYHNPVLLNECIEGLSLVPSGSYADVTFGGGGHSSEILKNLKTGKLIAFDKDVQAQPNIPSDDRIEFVHHSFAHLKNFLNYYNMIPLNGILADLGISSWQIDTEERGFSTRFDNSPLDMSMGVGSDRTAKQIIAEYSEAELKRIFSEYGEIHNSNRLARAIVEARQKNSIHTVGDLKNAIRNCVPREIENKYHAQVFQSLRIEVNNELDELKKLLVDGAEVLASGGRMVIISYHSLEDRLVKNFFAKGLFDGEPEKDVFGKNIGTCFKVITKKPITASDEEVVRNPRARSAKLRIAEKI